MNKKNRKRSTTNEERIGSMILDAVFNFFTKYFDPSSIWGLFFHRFGFRSKPLIFVYHEKIDQTQNMNYVWHSGKSETRSTPIDAWNNLSLSLQQENLLLRCDWKKNRLTKNFWTGILMRSRNDLWTWSWLDWKNHSKSYGMEFTTSKKKHEEYFCLSLQKKSNSKYS